MCRSGSQQAVSMGLQWEDAPCILLLNSKALNHMHATALPAIGGRLCSQQQRGNVLWEDDRRELETPGETPRSCLHCVLLLIQGPEECRLFCKLPGSTVTVAVLPSGNPLILVAHCIAACTQNLIINSEDMNKSLPFILGSEKYFSQKLLF